MNAVDDSQRNVDRQLAVAKLGPAIFVIRNDGRRLVLSKRKLEPLVRIDVTIRNMMNRLTNRPSAWSIRRVELLVTQVVYRCRNIFRQVRNYLDKFGSALWTDGRFIEFANWITKVI